MNLDTICPAHVYNLHMPACVVSASRKLCLNRPNCKHGIGYLDKKFPLYNPKLKLPGLTELHNSNPCDQKREDGTPVGLFNLGATCYMGVQLQTLFMNPDFRSIIYQYVSKHHNSQGAETIASYADHALVQLQRLFVRLQYGDKRAIDPSGFAKALSLPTGMQQDVQEFLNLLLSYCEAQIQDTQLAHDLKHLFYGVVNHSTVCSACGYTSARKSDFNMLQISIEGEDSLATALASYFKSEQLEGSNQYNCSRCRRKQNAERRIELDDVPLYLNVQLIRFHYDWETQMKIKVKTALFIPETIDIGPYLSNDARVKYAQENPNTSTTDSTINIIDTKKNNDNKIDDTEFPPVSVAVASSSSIPVSVPIPIKQTKSKEALDAVTIDNPMIMDALIADAAKIIEKKQDTLSSSSKKKKQKKIVVNATTDNDVTMVDATVKVLTENPVVIITEQPEETNKKATAVAVEEVVEEKEKGGRRRPVGTLVGTRKRPLRKAATVKFNRDKDATQGEKRVKYSKKEEEKTEGEENTTETSVINLTKVKATPTKRKRKQKKEEKEEGPQTMPPMHPIISCEFELVAVLFHHGSGANQGHYVASIKDHTIGKWVHFNDDKVTFRNHFYQTSNSQNSQDKAKKDNAKKELKKTDILKKEEKKIEIPKKESKKVDIEETPKKRQTTKKKDTTKKETTTTSEQDMDEMDQAIEQAIRDGKRNQNAYMMVFRRKTVPFPSETKPPIEILEQVQNENEEYLAQVNGYKNAIERLQTLQNERREWIENIWPKDCNIIETTSNERNWEDKMRKEQKVCFLPLNWLKRWLTGCKKEDIEVLDKQDNTIVDLSQEQSITIEEETRMNDILTDKWKEESLNPGSLLDEFETIQCEHGHCDPKKLSMMKRVTPDVFHELFKHYAPTSRHATKLSKLCNKCVDSIKIQAAACVEDMERVSVVYDMLINDSKNIPLELAVLASPHERIRLPKKSKGRGKNKNKENNNIISPISQQDDDNLIQVKKEEENHSHDKYFLISKTWHDLFIKHAEKCIKYYKVNCLSNDTYGLITLWDEYAHHPDINIFDTKEDLTKILLCSCDDNAMLRPARKKHDMRERKADRVLIRESTWLHLISKYPSSMRAFPLSSQSCTRCSEEQHANMKQTQNNSDKLRLVKQKTGSYYTNYTNNGFDFPLLLRPPQVGDYVLLPSSWRTTWYENIKQKKKNIPPIWNQTLLCEHGLLAHYPLALDINDPDSKGTFPGVLSITTPEIYQFLNNEYGANHDPITVKYDYLYPEKANSRKFVMKWTDLLFETTPSCCEKCTHINIQADKNRELEFEHGIIRLRRLRSFEELDSKLKSLFAQLKCTNIQAASRLQKKHRGEKVVEHVNSTSTIGYLKLQIFEATNLKPNRVRLFWGHTELDDDTKTIMEHGILNDSVLFYAIVDTIDGDLIYMDSLTTEEIPKKIEMGFQGTVLTG